MELEQYEEAVRDYEKVCKMDKSRGRNHDVQAGRMSRLINMLTKLPFFTCFTPNFVF